MKAEFEKTYSAIDVLKNNDIQFRVESEDEGAGYFVIVSGWGDGCGSGNLRIDPEEWATLREAIDELVERCNDMNAYASKK